MSRRAAGRARKRQHGLGVGPRVCCWMGAAVLKPAKPAGSGKTRAGIERLRRELEERKREGASRSATAWDPAGAQLPALSGQARGTEHKAAAAVETLIIIRVVIIFIKRRTVIVMPQIVTI